MTETPAPYRTKRRTPPPPAPVAAMRLVQFDEARRILAGHHREDESAFVLRKTAGGEWLLYEVPVSEADQALRSLVAADATELAELMDAIAQTMHTTRERREG